MSEIAEAILKSKHTKWKRGTHTHTHTPQIVHQKERMVRKSSKSEDFRELREGPPHVGRQVG